MSDRPLRLGDLAAAMAASARAPGVSRLRLVIPMLVRTLPDGAALWQARVHAARRRRVPWLARWRRWRRRRGGWVPIAIELHWTRAGVVARAGGRRLALFAPSSSPAGDMS